MSYGANTIVLSDLQSSSWYAVIEDLPGVTFKLKDFYLPGVGLPIIPLGGTGNFSVAVAGTRLQFENTAFEFAVDADLTNYRSALEWMFKSVSKPIYKTITVFFLNGQKEFQNVTVEFHNCKIINLTPLLLDTVNNETDIHCNMNVSMDYFSFIDPVDIDLTNFFNNTTETMSESQPDIKE